VIISKAKQYTIIFSQKKVVRFTDNDRLFIADEKELKVWEEMFMILP
jgi:hypothetical protein